MFSQIRCGTPLRSDHAHWLPDFAGRPDFDINVGDLKPNWLVGVAAVTMLALRQPLTGVKTFGDTEFKQPTAGLALVSHLLHPALQSCILFRSHFSSASDCLSAALVLADVPTTTAGWDCQQTE